MIDKLVGKGERTKAHWHDSCTHRKAMIAEMRGVNHRAAGHRIRGVAVRKIMRKREVCLPNVRGQECGHMLSYLSIGIP